ncbi:hypothetical protein P5673_009260 [Acropora cervicornis]|uniref:Uncharacterized protein n=1 Tax=Acropora cervicornis TaxID=6130 RepID=A0AAD9QSL2_ACRCE|nr:hypothetical protein P5673_009260 [Acropora cervicornis]
MRTKMQIFNWLKLTKT